MSRVSSLLRSFDPFASCVSDAAIFYAVEEKSSAWWDRNVWHFVRLDDSGCATWRGALQANQNIGGRSLSHPLVELKISGYTSFIPMRTRRLLWAWAYGYETLPDGKQTDFSTDEVISMTCWNHLCVSAQHMEKVDRTELGYKTWAKETGQVAG